MIKKKTLLLVQNSETKNIYDRFTCLVDMATPLRRLDKVTRDSRSKSELFLCIVEPCLHMGETNIKFFLVHREPYRKEVKCSARNLVYFSTMVSVPRFFRTTIPGFYLERICFFNLFSLHKYSIERAF